MMTSYVYYSAKGLIDYYTRNLSIDDYWFDLKSIDGRWHGKLSRELGLPDRVSRKTFSKLARNRHPITGKKLTQRDVANRRSAFELTFSSVKSASIMAMLSPHREEIIRTHRLAVRAAMRAIEFDVRTRTRINGGQVYVRTGNLVYARFDHFTARPTKVIEEGIAKYASDPQLHSHCLIMNCTSYQGRLQALEMGKVLRQAPYYEAIYNSHFAKTLADLGYRIERTKVGWEIKSKGFTRRTIERFSNRSQEIEKLAKKLGITNAKTKAGLAAKSRVSKSKVKHNEALINIWRKRLTTHEKQAIAHVKNQPEVKAKLPTQKEVLDKALAHHLERKSAVPVKRLLATALKNGYGHVTLKEIQNELSSRDNVIRGTKYSIEHVTTKEMVKAEDKMIWFVAEGKNKIAPLNPNYSIKREFLIDEQRRAVKQILESTDKVSILHGVSGGGKSTILQEIHEGAKSAGKNIFAFAPSAGASRDVLRSKGFANADTIAAFLKNRDLQKQTRNQVILIDEASLIGVSTMNKIFDVARRQNARMILSGDIRQHSSPEHGDAMRLIIERVRPEVAELTMIRRQHANPEYKQVIALLAKGKIRQGFAKLDRMGAILAIEDIDARHTKIAKDYITSLSQNRSAIIISPTHAEGMKITSAVRETMKVSGRITGKEKRFIIHKSLSLTNAEKTDMANYEDGMIVRFHQNVKGGFKAGVTYEVKRKSDTGRIVLYSNGALVGKELPTGHAQRFDVYERKNIAIAAGDKIRLTGNGKTNEGGRIYNGQVFRIDGFTKSGNIQISKGRTIDKSFATWTYGYVQTSHAAQGKDAHDVLIAQSATSFSASNDKQFYVSASRGRERIKIYTDSKKALREAVARSGERISAKEIAIRHLEHMRNRVRYYTINKNINYETGRDRQHKSDKNFEQPLRRGLI